MARRVRTHRRADHTGADHRAGSLHGRDATVTLNEQVFANVGMGAGGNAGAGRPSRTSCGATPATF